MQVLDYFSTKFGYSEEMKHKLSKISSATIGRMISPEISKYSIRGISTTRPAKNLNKLIPIRVYFEWDTLEPGFFEADTVANCGMSTEGQYISTLTLTDVFSGWTENRALLNKAQRWVKEAVDDVKKKLPFQMKGLDSDNGSELKNTQLLGWCQENHVEFTRSRPYRKNDNCYVEQRTNAFSGCTVLTSISFPENVTKIDEGAFFGYNSLKHIEFGSLNVTLGMNALRNI